MGPDDPIFVTRRRSAPPVTAMGGDGGTLITTSSELEEALRGGHTSAAGAVVNDQTALRVAAVYGCVRLIAGTTATLPIDIRRRVDERTRVQLADHPVWSLLRRRPNRWQKPAEFKRMMTAHVLLRGEAVALKVKGARGELIALVPLAPDRVRIEQRDDLSIVYHWTSKRGQQVTFRQDEVLSLKCLTLDGVRGVTPITYARDTIGVALAMDRHAGTLFRNGAVMSGVARTDNQLSETARRNIKESIDEFKTGGNQEGGTLVLEEGLDYKPLTMSQEDAEWIESKKLSRSDIAMYFGVPPSMIGDNSGSDSNWGTGLEQKSNGYVTYTAEDYLTMWEEAVWADCLDTGKPDDIDLYARFNRAALVKGDIKTRWEAYVKGLQWGVWSPNEVRALEDANPRDGGDIYYPPPNTAGRPASEKEKEDPDA